MQLCGHNFSFVKALIRPNGISVRLNLEGEDSDQYDQFVTGISIVKIATGIILDSL